MNFLQFLKYTNPIYFLTKIILINLFGKPYKSEFHMLFDMLYDYVFMLFKKTGIIRTYFIFDELKNQLLDKDMTISKVEEIFKNYSSNKNDILEIFNNQEFTNLLFKLNEYVKL